MRSVTNIDGNDLNAFLLNKVEFTGPAELFTVTLKSGYVMHYTPWQVPIVCLGQKFDAGPPLFERGKIDEQIGTAVSTMSFTIKAKPENLIGTMPILQTIVRGDWDGAQIFVERLFMDVNGAQIGKVIRFFGELGEIQSVGRMQATFKAKTMMGRLQQQQPQYVIQPPCRFALFDAGCALNRNSFAVNVVVQAGSTVNVLKTNAAQATNYFQLGDGVFTSGLNSGLGFGILSHVNGSPALIYPSRPFFVAPQAGDLVTLFPGCDNLFNTCNTKFNNKDNYGGQEFVPSPETAL